LHKQQATALREKRFLAIIKSASLNMRRQTPLRHSCIHICNSCRQSRTHLSAIAPAQIVFG
jgi:hypothetical protein